MKKEKTMHELCKEFPDKGYRELEKYRDADRVEEAIGFGHNHPPKDEQAGVCIMGEMRKDREGEEQDNPELFKTEIDYHRYWKDKAYDQLLKELNMLRGTKVIVESLSTKNKRLQDEIDRIKKENNDLYNRIAEALAVNESHQKLNGKLQERLTELEEENKKLHEHVDKQVSGARKSGM